MPSIKTPSIGVIVSSTRQPRICPQIAAFVTQTLEDNRATSATLPPAWKLQLIDLAAWNLPLFDEPTIPSQITNSADYQQPHTRAWSAEIQKHDAFIFILPQYNWGYPAAVKNALDYLFKEWSGKPAMIVSYGGHGGDKAAAQLRQVLQGLEMLTAETMPALKFPSRAVTVQATRGEEMGLLGESPIWESEKEGIVRAFGEMMALMSKEQVSPS